VSRGGDARALPAPADTGGLGRGRGRATRVETWFVFLTVFPLGGWGAGGIPATPAACALPRGTAALSIRCRTRAGDSSPDPPPPAPVRRVPLRRSKIQNSFRFHCLFSDFSGGKGRGGGDFYHSSSPAEIKGGKPGAVLKKIRVAGQIFGKGVMARRLCPLPKSLPDQLMPPRNINDKKKKKNRQPGFHWLLPSPRCITHAPLLSARGTSGWILLIYIPRMPPLQEKKKKAERKRKVSFAKPTPPLLNPSFFTPSRLSRQGTCCSRTAPEDGFS